MKIKTLAIGLALLGFLAVSSALASAENNSDDNAANDLENEVLMFGDVNEGDEHFDAIFFLYNTHFIKGYDVGEELRYYKPVQNINRAEFLILLLEGSGTANHKKYDSCFKDVPAGEWYTTFVCQAKEEGWVNGYPDGTFKPAQTINEVESLKILGEISNWEIGEPAEGEEWYQPYLDIAEEKDIVPDKPVAALMNRGDIAEIVFRIIQVESLGIDAFDETLIEDLYNVYNIPYIGADDVAGDTDDDVIGDTDDTEGMTPLVTCCVPDMGGSCVRVSKENCSASGVEVVGINSCYPDPCTGPPAATVSKIEISHDGPIVACTETVANITITVYDENDNPVEGRDLELTAFTGLDIVNDLTVAEAGEGVYTSSFGSTLAGDYTLTVTDTETGVEGSVTLTIEPNSLDHVEIIDVIDPSENNERNKALIKVVSRDVFGNVIPYSSVNNKLSAVTTFGTVTDVTHDAAGVFTIEITANDWGVAEVMIVEEGSGISFGESAQVAFLPIQLDMPKGISADTAQIEVPLYIYFPDGYGELGTYDFTLIYDTDTLSFYNVTDPDPDDDFDAPLVEVNEATGTLRLWQMNNESPLYTPQALQAGTILFNVDAVGAGTIYISEAQLTNTDGDDSGFLANIFEGFFKWWYEIKDDKEICIDVYIFPGSGAAAGNVNTDIANANSIFFKNSESCNCDYLISVRLNALNTLTAAQWSAVDANGDNDLDIAELITLRNNHPPSGGCIPVYYPPAINGTALGWSWYNAAAGTGGAVIDHSRDNHHKTLAHELTHQASHNEVVDTGNANAPAQGSNNPKNLMNGNDIGDDLTEAQCELIEKYLP